MKGLRGEFLRFIVTGLAATAVNFVVYLAAHAVGTPLWFASAAGYVAGLVISFEVGRLWVFRSDKPRDTTIILRFLAVYAASGVLFTGLTEVLVRGCALDYRLAWFLGTGVVACTNFAGARFFVFQKSRSI
jgi:putative flippase GtrA